MSFCQINNEVVDKKFFVDTGGKGKCFMTEDSIRILRTKFNDLMRFRSETKYEDSETGKVVHSVDLKMHFPFS
jgi:hypothetical protein